MKSRKKLILSIFILLILNLNIFYANGVSQINKTSLLSNSNVSQLDKPFFDVEREIQRIENNLNPSNPIGFSPSPIFENEIPRDISSSLKVQEDSLIVNIDLEKQVLSLDEPLSYVIQATRGFQPAVGEYLTIEVIKGQYYGWYFYDFNKWSNYEERIIESHNIITNQNGEYKGQFSTSISGRYSIVVRTSADYIQETRSFTVANIGLFWRVSREFIPGEPHYSVAYILNTTDFSPILAAEVELSAVTYDYNNEINEYIFQKIDLFNGISNQQGIVEINCIPPHILSSNYGLLANLTASFNGQTVYVSRNIYRGGYYWDWDGYSEFKPYEFVITTDKPIYFPGETIQARILVWKNDYLKVTKEPVQTSIMLKILSPSQHILINKELNTNSYGVASYSFSLDTESELGQYSIIIQKDSTISAIELRVDKYEKPAFRVNLALDHEYISPGNVLSGNITAEYYFGKPVSNSEVKIQIDDFYTINTETDARGFVKFQYRLPGEAVMEGKYSLSINATVTDTVGRKVTSFSEVQITDEIYVWAYVNPWFPKVNENITLYFGAYQYSNSVWYWRNWKPLSNAFAKITIYALLPNDKEQFIKTQFSQTDDNGQGQVQLELPSQILSYTTRFKGVIEVKTDDGRKDTSNFYFSVDSNIIDISLIDDDLIFHSGDIIEISVNIRNAISGEKISSNAQFRIFDSDYDMIGQTQKFIPASGTELTYKLSSFAPTGKYLLHAYIETTFDYEWGSRSYYRYSKTIEFNVGSSYELTLFSDKESYSLSDNIVITGQITGTTNVPLMVQIVKNGILATEYVDLSSSSSFEIRIESIAIFAPYVWIFAFAILDDGTILDSSLYIEVNLALSVAIESDKSVYEPGETAHVEIKVYDSNNRAISSVLAISFIDSSVFGVEPDPENELNNFQQRNYWPSVWTVVSWKNRQNDWWFWWFEDYLFIYGGAIPRGGIIWDNTYDFMTPERDFQKSDSNTEISTDNSQEIRDNLPENAYWCPFIIAENGNVEIDLVLPDTIGEWTIRVIATTESGIGTLEKYTFKTFLPFFVEIDKEPFVLQDDIFIIKGIVYNYLGEIVNIDLEIETDKGILVLAKNDQTTRLPDGYLSSIGWACLAEDVGYWNITLYAKTLLLNGTMLQDALRKPMEILPNGINTEFKASGFIFDNESFLYTRYDESVKQKEFLELSLGLGAIAINSWERLVGYPYGCTEQTISRLIPNALILQYLNVSDQLTNETKDYISDMIISGISRIYSQQHYDGGWGWWYSDLSRVYMTSLVLHGLKTVNRTGFYIEPSIITKALKLLKDYQNPDGSWTPDSWRGIDQASFTAFVLRSIFPWENSYSLSSTISQAILYIEGAWNNDPSIYLASLYMNSVPESGYSDPDFDSLLLSYIAENVKHSSDGNYWTYSKDDFYWRALGGNIEITALALSALIENNYSIPMYIIRGAVQWLLNHQSRYGWGNTADTAAAISAIVTLIKSPASSDEDASVILYLNDIELNTYDLSSSHPSVYIDLAEILSIGVTKVNLTKIGAGDVNYYFSSEQVLRTLPSIDLPDKITAEPNQQVQIPITISPISLIVFASQMTLTPLSSEISPITNLPQTIDHLTQQTIVSFSYISPSKEGIYEISGFEISYRLSDENQKKYSPGYITRVYGPINLEVSKATGNKKLNLGIQTEVEPIITSPDKEHQVLESPSNITVEREYSRVNNFYKGDLVFVTLKIVSKQVDNFLMLEDYVPVGFELDPNTISNPTGTYTLTTTGITFFFPELDIGTIMIRYGIIVMNVRQSLAVPARLSNMYDDWVELSSSTVLGDSRIPIDPSTGNVIRDLELPVLEDLKLEEKTTFSNSLLDIEITASDNWGVATVRVFINQGSTWNVLDCSKENEVWKTEISGLKEGYSGIYVELVDYTGNVKISEESSQYLEFADLMIPVIPIIGLLSIALVVGAVSSFYARKKYI